MDDMIGYCGLKCHDCPTPRATDHAAREQIAAHWAAAYPELFPDGLAAGSVRCAGCKGDEDALSGYCRTCEVRRCARARGHDTCADCGEYDACATLDAFFAAAPEPKAVLDALRSGAPVDGIETFK